MADLEKIRQRWEWALPPSDYQADHGTVRLGPPLIAQDIFDLITEVEELRKKQHVRRCDFDCDYCHMRDCENPQCADPHREGREIL